MTECQVRVGFGSQRIGARGGHTCTRKAAYTDGKGGLYCTQHAKEPPGTMQKASGKIRADLTRIASSETKQGIEQR